ncbi:PilZ domain-containing protein [Methylobacterium symbioticum]|uniref:PilZ domain-containing protein n=1 Tax=Methylobacterium symbioticum TaxID=2584084 RepID=A0A509ELA1_9HYPH|nr:PilZ domain-containing protein [Methylobacterium symbioticum]VUD74911.1 hypothetical protein MET9862_05545 [Methylobacterium symbioticum]
MTDALPELPAGDPAPAPLPADAPARPKRHRVVQQGRIVLGSRMTPCEIRDLSARGAKLRVAPALDLPEVFELAIAAHDLRIHIVRLRWRRGEFAGVTFEPGCP